MKRIWLAFFLFGTSYLTASESKLIKEFVVGKSMEAGNVYFQIAKENERGCVLHKEHDGSYSVRIILANTCKDTIFISATATGGALLQSEDKKWSASVNSNNTHFIGETLFKKVAGISKKNLDPDRVTAEFSIDNEGSAIIQKFSLGSKSSSCSALFRFTFQVFNVAEGESKLETCVLKTKIDIESIRRAEKFATRKFGDVNSKQTDTQQSMEK